MCVRIVKFIRSMINFILHTRDVHTYTFYLPCFVLFTVTTYLFFSCRSKTTIISIKATLSENSTSSICVFLLAHVPAVIPYNRSRKYVTRCVTVSYTHLDVYKRQAIGRLSVLIITFHTHSIIISVRVELSHTINNLKYKNN